MTGFHSVNSSLYVIVKNHLVLARQLAFSVVSLQELWRPEFPVAIAPTAPRNEESMEKAKFLLG